VYIVYLISITPPFRAYIIYL